MFQFTKNRRLLNKIEFDSVFKLNQKIATRDLVFLYSPNDLGYSRLGLVLSKKKIAKAHDRNRLKRVIRDTFRRQPLPSIDVVVLAKTGVKKDNFTELTLNKAWDRLLGLCEN